MPIRSNRQLFIFATTIIFFSRTSMNSVNCDTLDECIMTCRLKSIKFIIIIFYYSIHNDLHFFFIRQSVCISLWHFHDITLVHWGFHAFILYVHAILDTFILFDFTLSFLHLSSSASSILFWSSNYLWISLSTIYLLSNDLILASIALHFNSFFSEFSHFTII